MRQDPHVPMCRPDMMFCADGSPLRIRSKRSKLFRAAISSIQCAMIFHCCQEAYCFCQRLLHPLLLLQPEFQEERCSHHQH